jgi:serine/threonine-protein kinase
MTPEYASPEQVRGEPVSTATDVYALGCVLYEILTGERAHRFASRDPLEVARVVCESELPPPSDAGPRELRGDLDNIVLKALQKDPARRYGSALQLSEDLRRYLDGRTVLARPDTLRYRAG